MGTSAFPEISQEFRGSYFSQQGWASNPKEAFPLEWEEFPQGYPLNGGQKWRGTMRAPGGAQKLFARVFNTQ